MSAAASPSSPTRRAKPAVPTLARIAAVAGVDKSTVSRALRGHRVLPEATTRRIRRIARSLGYRHSPLVGAVMRRARGGGEHRGLGQVAYLTFDATPTAWRDQITFRQFFTGAEARGEQLGLQVVPFWMKQPGLNPRRATAILEARGITGLLIGPTTGWTQTPELNWQRFCTVKVGAPFPDLPLPCAVHHHFRGMIQALDELEARGYRRPGLALRDYQEAKTGGAWSAPFFLRQQRMPARDRVPPLWLEELAFDRFAAWHRRHRPDVIIGQGNHWLGWLKQLGLRVPADIGFVDLDRCTTDRAGIDQRSPAIGAAAIDLLLNRLLEHECGLPTSSSILQVEGVWANGPSVRSR